MATWQMPEDTIYEIIIVMGAVTRSKAGRSAWKAYRRKMVPVGIFGLFLIVGCFSFVALIVNGHLGVFATLLLIVCMVSIPVSWNKNLEDAAEDQVEVGGSYSLEWGKRGHR
jgi:hypothetical protein